MILKELLSYQRAPLLASREVHNRNTSITISMLYSFISVGHQAIGLFTSSVLMCFSSRCSAALTDLENQAAWKSVLWISQCGVQDWRRHLRHGNFRFGVVNGESGNVMVSSHTENKQVQVHQMLPMKSLPAGFLAFQFATVRLLATCHLIIFRNHEIKHVVQ